MTIWELLSRARNVAWALSIVFSGMVLVFGYIQNVPISFLIPAALLAAVLAVALALLVDSATRRWLRNQPMLPPRIQLLCELRNDAKSLRDIVMARHDPGLDYDDVAFNTIFRTFPERLRMYLGDDAERDYANVVGKQTLSSESIKVSADLAYATINQMTELAIRRERDQAAIAKTAPSR